MKKKLILGLVTIGSAALLCGFDNTQSADDVYNKMSEAIAAQSGMTSELKMHVDADLQLSDSSGSAAINFLREGAFSVASTTEPKDLQVKGTITRSSIGAPEELLIEGYSVEQNDGQMKSYIYTEKSSEEGGHWAISDGQTVSTSSLPSPTMTSGELAEWGIYFELAPEAADLNGTECYVLDATVEGYNFFGRMDYQSLANILLYLSDALGTDSASGEDVDMGMSILNDLCFNISCYVDSNTYLPIQYHIDMNNSSMSNIDSMINRYLGRIPLFSNTADTTANLLINDASVDGTVSFDTIPEISVPQAGLDAEMNGTADSISSFAQEIFSAFIM